MSDKQILDRMMPRLGVPAAQRRMAETVGDRVISDILQDNKNGPPIAQRSGMVKSDLGPGRATAVGVHRPLASPPGMALIDGMAEKADLEERVARVKAEIAAGRGEKAVAEFKRWAEAKYGKGKA
jgi:hypothetical protein